MKSKINKQFESTPPSGLQVIWREFKKDKVALCSLIVIGSLIVGILVAAFFIDQEKVMTIDLHKRFTKPGVDGFILGADQAGRDILGQLIIGSRNSLIIAMVITLFTGIVGIVLGMMMGYYGGLFDQLLMRIIDFFMTLPTLMIIIVFVSMIPKFGVWELIVMMGLFLWVGTARLVRSKVLSEGRRDYVSASKTMGASNVSIMFKEILPNLSSIIIVELTLSFAGNVGIETGLSFLGFGLPPSTPSLGTLVSYATNPQVLADKYWVWLPASLLILVFMLGINYIGQALRRSADVKQRFG